MPNTGLMVYKPYLPPAADNRMTQVGTGTNIYPVGGNLYNPQIAQQMPVDAFIPMNPAGGSGPVKRTAPVALDFKQGSRVGDCFLLAVLDGLSRNPKGAQRLASIMGPKQGDGWNVVFPGQPEFPQRVTDDELNHLDTNKMVAEGPTGVQILEAAYIKLKAQQNPRKFPWMGPEWPKPPKGLKSLDFVDENLGHLAFKDLTGWPAVGVMATPGVGQKESLSFAEQGKKTPQTLAQMEGILSLVARQPERFVLTACTITNPKKSLLNWRHMLGSFHDYTVRQIDPVARKITLANPWNNKKLLTTLSYEDFAKYFCYLSIGVVPQ